MLFAILIRVSFFVLFVVFVCVAPRLFCVFDVVFVRLWFDLVAAAPVCAGLFCFVLPRASGRVSFCSFARPAPSRFVLGYFCLGWLVCFVGGVVARLFLVFLVVRFVLSCLVLVGYVWIWVVLF